MRKTTLAGRSAGALAASLFAAAIGFCIGWGGPAGLLLFPFVLPVVIFTAGPGSALLLWELGPGGNSHLGFRDLPFAYILGGIWGGSGLGYGACHGL
jgi:hypothetical protein